MSRRIARENAIKFLYSTVFNKNENIYEQLQEFLYSANSMEEDFDVDIMGKNDAKFAEDLIKGTLERIEDIDNYIQLNTVGWTKDRIAKVDLAILRLAIYEILYRDDIPDSVAVNEAIELSKKYSTDESGGFINGILGKIIRGKNGIEV
jgi:N utilization substance protein B